MNFLCQLHFCGCDKVPEKVNFQVVGLIWAHGFRPWSLDSDASGPEAGPSTMVGQEECGGVTKFLSDIEIGRVEQERMRDSTPFQGTSSVSCFLQPHSLKHLLEQATEDQAVNTQTFEGTSTSRRQHILRGRKFRWKEAKKVILLKLKTSSDWFPRKKKKNWKMLKVKEASLGCLRCLGCLSTFCSLLLSVLCSFRGNLIT